MKTKIKLLRHQVIDSMQGLKNAMENIRGVEFQLEEMEAELKKNDVRNIIKFKEIPNHNLKEEFERCDNRLRFIFLAYTAYIYIKYGYMPTITTVERTQAEQDLIYANNAEYQKKPWYSTHQPLPKTRAIDFRNYDMSEEISTDTKLFFTQVVYTGERGTLLRHNIGLGQHNHLQTDDDGYTCLKRG